LEGQIRRNAEAYVDDIVVKSEKHRDLLDDLKETFDNLCKFKMMLNPKKYVFDVSLGKLFVLGSKHKTFLLRWTVAQRSSGCKLIGGRRADLRRHAGPNRIRSSRLRGRCSLASIVIALGIILPVVATIGHLRIDWAGRVEILVYEHDRFIRVQI
jgi:hypothetical protein